MPQSGGLVTSFLDSLQGLTQMERERKRDQQAAVQQSVENAMRQHAQEQEGKRIELESTAQKQRQTYQDQELAIRRDSEKRQEDAQKETERKNRSAEQARTAAYDLKLKSLDATTRQKVKTEREKDFRSLVALGYDEATAAQVADQRAAEHADQYSSPAETMAKQPVQQPMPVDPAAPAAPSGATPAAGPAGVAPLVASRIKHLDALTAHTAEETKQLQELSDSNKRYKEAQIKATIARTVREETATKLLPKQFEEKKWYDGQRLQIEKINAEAHRLQANVAANGPQTRVSLAQAKESAIGLRQYAREVKKDYDAAAKAEREAASANAYAGNLIKNLRGKQTLTPGEQEMLIKAQTVWDENNTKDAKGGTRLGQLTRDRMQAGQEFHKANIAAQNMENVYSTPVSKAGGLRPAPIAPSDLRPTGPPPKSTVDGLNRSLNARTYPRLGGPVRVKTPADAQKLKVGTHYVTPDGREMVR